MQRRITAVSQQPDLAPLVAGWLHAAFGHPDGRTAKQLTDLILAPPIGPEETFVAFEDDIPVGTASLAHQDLDSRRDLTPWLAGVVVQPPFRGRGHAAALVRQVEGFARAAGIGRLWLYTWSAAGLYARLGWQEAGREIEMKRNQEVILMRRDLTETA
ncbi:GNAT family N-acetyltransferase [Paracraurococcus lichenis]|uniref:GNAT family N-acetyltransferase n=1 Tax=Paracraurococcus lichenis TaxID=3064888 RepID=A0ABT9E7F6_9PROT|nr:GNAT family N-acetyltransferase [Paracraurococcus sp. LOR1-02]MDO9712064.1 GNAT family N-acetyltransferase [Paracraurococcus sp. LOR1-02]